MPSSSRTTLPALLVACLCATAACATPREPTIRYQGDVSGRPPRTAESMKVFRSGPPPSPYKDLGTVIVTCPSRADTDINGRIETYGACEYELAVGVALAKAGDAGADGIHSIDASANAAGQIVSLRATAFIYTPNAAAPAARPTESKPTVEERLKQLEKLKKDQLISPEEYAAKRAEILKDI